MGFASGVAINAWLGAFLVAKIPRPKLGLITAAPKSSTFPVSFEEDS